jgi:uncharacterized membrane protein
MESRAKLLGHPVHQMLIVFPLGLLGMAVIFDIVGMATDGVGFVHAAYLMIAAGIVTSLIAAVFGLIDWLAIPSGTRAKRIGLLHGGGNVVVVLLFVIAWLMRRSNPPTVAPVELGLEIAGLLLALVTGWLGGELVDRLGIGVDPGAHVNAPSSLSASPPVKAEGPRFER